MWLLFEGCFFVSFVKRPIAALFPQIESIAIRPKIKYNIKRYILAIRIHKCNAMWTTKRNRWFTVSKSYATIIYSDHFICSIYEIVLGFLCHRFAQRYIWRCSFFFSLSLDFFSVYVLLWFGCVFVFMSTVWWVKLHSAKNHLQNNALKMHFCSFLSLFVFVVSFAVHAAFDRHFW